MIVWTHVGNAAVLQAITNKAAFLGLYGGNVMPTPEMTSGSDLGELAPSTGYERASLKPADWRIDADLGLAQHAKVEFLFTAPPGLVRGYLVTDIGGSVVWASPFENARDFSEFGGRLGIIPTIRLRSNSV